MKMNGDSVTAPVQSWRQAGRKVTKARLAVLAALAEAGCGADARHVHRLAERVHPKIGLVTVYRTLELLVREGWVDRWQEGGVARYELARPHHHHLVCLRCGSVVRWEDCPVDLPAGAKLEAGFLVTGHRLEVLGYCPSCQEARG
jgi:Fur family ferric uptake transcriptional regulator